jgi:putative DNA primase/helicase
MTENVESGPPDETAAVPLTRLEQVGRIAGIAPTQADSLPKNLPLPENPRPLPKNPADCDDPQLALILWQAKIAKESAGSNDLSTLLAACLDMARRAPLLDPFRDAVIESLLRCATRHLGQRHSPETIEPIFFEAFPEKAQDDPASVNAELDAETVAIDGRAETVAAIVRLAKLPTVEYEPERAAAAERLGIRVSALDTSVKGARAEGVATKGQGRPFQVTEIEAWPQPVDGAPLLAELVNAVRRYVVMPEGMADMTALWTIHAHCFDSFMHSPRLAITSPEKRCGKTTLLDVLACLVPRPLSTSNATVSAIFRVIEITRPTLLMDEADTFLRKNDELRGILNSGHRKGGSVLRNVGDDHEPRQFSTWGPAAIAMIGRLPNTLDDRSLNCRLRRRKPGERVESFRSDRADHLHILARKMARWATENEGQLRASDPEMGELQNRTADNWRPLFAIADLVGGPWPARARAVATVVDAARSEQSIGILVLADCKAAFNTKKADRLPSEELAAHLNSLDDRPWSEFNDGKPLSMARLARLLSAFDIESGSIRLPDGRTPKGYYLSAFGDAFSSYLPSKSATAPQPNNDGLCGAFQNATATARVARSRPPQAHSHGHCGGVALFQGRKPARRPR